MGLYGKMPGIAPQDLAHSKLILLWGANPDASGIHHLPPLQKARAAGAKLVVVDPRRTRQAEQADLHLAIRPGTDLPLALSLIRMFFETGRADQDFLVKHCTGVAELRAAAAPWTIAAAARVCGVPASQIAELFELYS